MFLLVILLLPLLTFAATLWLQLHGHALKAWLLEPFRAWTGLNETRRPKP